MLASDISIYALRHKASGRYYFGQTCGSVQNRWLAHKASARAPKTPIAKAIAEYGPEAFEVLAFARGLTKADADEWERTLCERHESDGLFNHMFTARARDAMSVRKRGCKLSVETRAKQSAAHRARWQELPEQERARRTRAWSAAGVSARQGRAALKPKPTQDETRAMWRLKAKQARDRRKALANG